MGCYENKPTWGKFGFWLYLEVIGFPVSSTYGLLAADKCRGILIYTRMHFDYGIRRIQCC